MFETMIESLETWSRTTYLLYKENHKKRRNGISGDERNLDETLQVYRC